ncbi:folate family ECF transporter S component [Wukongibacter sp. M2B1]|uniref:folate family ECF transporter S component n=1 Tax=Wukongibacter sp. M2B1 TaxID=3088895 RepID=UPI003D7964A4
MKNIKLIVYMGLFIALEVVLTRFLSIQTPIVRIGFTFLPIAISAIMFGPLFSGTVAALADVIGMILFPTGGVYFPGFTLTAFFSGVIYGLFLYKKPVNIFRILIPVTIIAIVINLALNSVWLWMITGKGFMAILPARIIRSLIMIPIEVTMIQVVWQYIGSYVKHELLPKVQMHNY